MANRVRGIRQKLPPNTVIGTGSAARGTTLPAQAMSLPVLLNKLAQQGSIPLPGGGITTLTGDVTAGPGSGSQAATLATVNTDVGSYTSANITVNAKGLVTAAADGASGSYNARGAWDGFSAYAVDDVVTYGGSAYLCYSAVTAPSGSPSIDGVVQAAGISGTSLTVNLTTTNSTDFIIVVSSESASVDISSISSTGLTFAKRAIIQIGGGFGSNTEYWVAQASALLANQAITINYSQNLASSNGSVVTVFGMTGLTAFDANGSLPLETTTTAAVSTSSAPDIIFWIGGSNSAVHSVSHTDFPAGFAQVGSDQYSQVNSMAVGFMQANSTLSSQNFSPANSAALIVDAIVTGIVTNTPPSMEDANWLSQGAAYITSVSSDFTVSGSELELAATAVSAGSYTLADITVDANGRVTAASNGSAPSGYITSVDSNFAVSSAELSLATIASGDVLGNSGASTAEPGPATMTAMLDRAFGSTEGQLLQRGSSAWQVLAAGTSGQALLSGGASALNAWGAARSTSAPQCTVYTSSSGTYTTPTGALWLQVEGIGGGGGGGAVDIVATATATNGGTGGDTTFGGLTGGGGNGGFANNGAAGTEANGRVGGDASGGDLNISGGSGGDGQNAGSANALDVLGGAGGDGVFGGGAANTYRRAANPGVTNSGGGGGGSATLATATAAGGGGAGGYFRKLITSPSSTYAYAVGAAGAAGTQSSGNGQNGGAGGSGVIIVTAYF